MTYRRTTRPTAAAYSEYLMSRGYVVLAPQTLPEGLQSIRDNLMNDALTPCQKATLAALLHGLGVA